MATVGSASPGVLDVVVVGAGAAGLAVAAELQRRGRTPVVLEQGDAVGQRWHERYDRLHLHTVRRHSGLPRMPIPRAAGRFVAGAEFARYLDTSARTHGLDVRLRTEVATVERIHPGPGARWALSLRSGKRLAARTVVIATGRAASPLDPAWPGTDRFAGHLLHSAEYRSGARFAGQRVLVVGAGNSGGEIAVDLAESGAASVDLAVRTPPHIVRRELGPFWSAQQSGLLLGRLPARLLDAVARVQARLTVPDLTQYGLPRPQDGLATRARRDGVVPLQDVGLIAAVRGGAVHVRSAVAALQPDGAEFSDGTTGSYDAIIAATGFGPGLEALIGDATLLTPQGLPSVTGGRFAAPGICFVGFSITLGGALRDAGIEARRAARAIALEHCG